MKHVLRVILLSVITPLLLLPKTAHAATPPSLVISQFKVTSSDGQFFMLYNSSDQAIDMATVQLVYYNHYSLASATSSKVITLSGSLPSHGYYLVNDGPLTLCYRMLVNSVSLGFSTTAGSVQVARLTQSVPGAPVTSTIEDAVSWSKTAVGGVTLLPASPKFLLRNPVDALNNPDVSEPGAGSWQTVAVSASDACALTTTVTTAPPPVMSASLLLLASTPPPVTILSLVAETVGPSLPSADIGLMVPIINELLVNPGSPGSDANDEFIELYNPNDKAFDLTGFQLEVGMTTKDNYKFPDGTLLNGKSFTAFTSAQTGLALNNTSGQARLLDPFGNVVNMSEEYGGVKENLAWALANNDWFWTTAPTPNAANVINTAAAGSAKKTAAVSAVKTSVKGASSSANLPSAATAANADQAAEVARLHPSALASVAVLAVGYGAYEYKQDIANRLRKFRSDRAARRALSPKP